MSADQYKRKLTAIVSADVVGYSRLMEADETATLAALTIRKSVMTDLIIQYRGRVVDAPGDNLLAAFASAVDAVNCAVEIQRRIAQENHQLSEAQQMQFRIGINLDDVIEEQGLLYGEGVNIAARIQALAPAGGICVSAAIYDQVSHRIGLAFEHLGEQSVKNIDKPVRIYRLAEPSNQNRGASANQPRRNRAGRLALLSFLVIIGSILSLMILDSTWFLGNQNNSHPPERSERVVSPTIAVLPFDDYSPNAHLEQFADALTDDIITNLSKITGLSVVARNSVFTYKNKPVKVQDVARDLNVAYVLEGSVRGIGDNILFNAQFIDARTGHHLWANRYDVELKHLFTMQVDITMKIVSALNLHLTSVDKAALQAQGEDYLQAYLKRIEAGEMTASGVNTGDRAEIIFWESIKDSKEPAMFKEYLHQFPDGIFVGLAKLNSQKTIAAPTAPTSLQETPKPNEHHIKKEIISAVPITVKEAPKAMEKERDNGRQEELFWHSIDQSQNIAEYEEFLRQFPEGTFAGLARIKIATLKKAKLEDTSAGRKKKEISLAICTGQTELLGGNIGLYVTFEKIDSDNGAQNERIISNTLAVVFKQKPLFLPQYSYYCLGDAFPLKSDCKNSDLKLNSKDIWVKKSISRSAPDVQAIGDLCNRLTVDALLVIRSYYIYPPSLVVDFFLIDPISGHRYQESVLTNYGYMVSAQEIKTGLLKLLNRFETASN